VLPVILAGCQAASGVVPDSQMKLDVSNGTNLRLELDVNGSKVSELRGGQQVELPAAQLPPLPWEAVVRFPNGRNLVSVTVRSGAVQGDSDSQMGTGARVDLSCGRIDIWSGPPMIGPAPGAGLQGDCAP
jgi:hypothetical protein